MIQNLFILTSGGQVLIEKQWGPRVKRTVVELFLEELGKVPSPADLCPVLVTPNFYLVHTHRFGLFFLSTVKKEVAPLLVLETHAKIIDIFVQYFEKLTETTIRENFSMVIQLLDEMVDGGFPLTIEPNQLKDMITPPSLAKKIMDTVTGSFSVTDKMFDASSRIPWRSPNVKHIQNEIFFDVIEQMDCVIASNEVMVSCEVFGEIVGNCNLSGMPDLTVNFVKPSIIDDTSLHRCVRIARWRQERVISFVPPDGKFTLMSYRVRGVNQVPVYVKPQVTVKQGSMKVSVSFGIRNTAGNPVDDVVIVIPFPATSTAHNFKVSAGEVRTDAVTKVCTWKISRVGVKDKTPVLEGLCAVPLDHPAAEKPTIRAFFAVRGVSASGIKVDKISAKNVRYKLGKYSRYITKAGAFEVRT